MSDQHVIDDNDIACLPLEADGLLFINGTDFCHHRVNLETLMAEFDNYAGRITSDTIEKM